MFSEWKNEKKIAHFRARSARRNFKILLLSRRKCKRFARGACDFFGGIFIVKNCNFAADPGKNTYIQFLGDVGVCPVPAKMFATPPPVTNSIVETSKVSAREALRQNNLVVILWKYVGTLEKVENR